MIIERPRRRGYQLHPPDSPEAEALLIERGLTRADLDHAIAQPSARHQCRLRSRRLGVGPRAAVAVGNARVRSSGDVWRRRFSSLELPGDLMRDDERT